MNKFGHLRGYAPHMMPDMTNLANILHGNRKEDKKLEREKQIDQMRMVAVQADRIRNMPDYNQQRSAVIQMAREAVQNGGDPSKWEALLSSGNKDQMDMQLTKLFTQHLDAGDYVDQKVKQQMTGQGSNFAASAKTEILEDGSVIQAMPDGSVVVRDPMGMVAQGKRRAEILLNAKQARENRLQSDADRMVDTARRTKRVEAQETRASELKKEISNRVREASRELPRMMQALQLAVNADQGLTGAAKLQLSRLYPELDVSDSAALDATLKQLALGQLKSFKGPTTDFEFGVVQDISGRLGNSRASNLARIASLQRANWFIRREADQFDRYTGDPDRFAFNYNEVIDTKQGPITLLKLRNTATKYHLTIEETLDVLNGKVKLSEVRKVYEQ